MKKSVLLEMIRDIIREELTEIKIVRRIRKGKLHTGVTCGQNQKAVVSGGKRRCVAQKAKERVKRHRSAIKAAKRMVGGKLARRERKFIRSMKKHKRLGL